MESSPEPEVGGVTPLGHHLGFDRSKGASQGILAHPSQSQAAGQPEGRDSFFHLDPLKNVMIVAGLLRKCMNALPHMIL